jgi:hypothetical protein
MENNTTVFLVAAHGTGKTVHAKTEHARSSTSISVCNTQALTVANAAVLDLTAVYDEVADKGACCIPSLPRYERPPEFFHVDEADAVHGFLHSGKVDSPLEAWRIMMDFAARSLRSMFASADLHFEDIALIVKAIRDRNMTRRFVVYLKRPKTDLKIKLCSIGRVRGEVHTTIKRSAPTIEGASRLDSQGHSRDRVDAPQYCPTFVGITTRKLAGQIAQGYRSVGASATKDLSEIADAIDSPRPEAAAQLAELFEAGENAETSAGAPISETPFFVSGENSRFADSIAWLEDTDRLVTSHSLLCTSPAVQSGVSLDPPVLRVLVLHTNRDVPADAVLQIVRRARNPVDRTVLIGLPAWEPQDHRTDQEYLDDLIAKRAKTTIRGIAAHFPELGNEHSDTSDPEFAWSWRITARRSIKSYANPVEELQRSAWRHGIPVEIDDTDANADARKAFARVVAAAREFRDSTNAKQVSAAETIRGDDRDRLSKASTLQAGERQQLERATLETFYKLPITPELVRRDNGGKYRTAVRNFTHTVLVHEFEDVVAYRDHFRGKGVQPTARTSDLPPALLLADLFQSVVGETLTASGGKFRVHDSRSKIRKWWMENYRKVCVFFPRVKGPPDEYEVRWFLERMRSIGAETRTKGASEDRVKTLTFKTVDRHAEAYATSLFVAYEQREFINWRQQK